ncbi:MAG: hypothetical protein IT454_06350 [Planctomycetes bacterium]|nr:hypothetical protein [Planctomycetota bacterium]
MTHPLSLVAAIGVVFALPSTSRAQSPFAPHLRWTHAPASGEAWLPSGLEFAAGGELLWSSGQGLHPRAQLFSTAPILAGAALDPLRAELLAGAYATVGVSAGASESELFTAAQYIGFDAAHRRTEIAKYDARAGSFAPLWRHTMGLVGNGASKFAAARDGAQLVCATHDAQFQVLSVEWLDGADGALRLQRASYAGTLRQLAATADTSRVALSVGSELRVLDDAGTSLLATGMPSATNALAFAGNGSRLAFGFGAQVRVMSDVDGLYVLTRDVASAPGEVATRVSLSDDGATLAIGWWNAVDTRTVRLQVWDLAHDILRYERVVAAPGTGLQNYVEAALVGRDGHTAAFGCWGTADAQPEVLVVDVESGQESLVLDLPGSVRALALDPSGTRVAVGTKATHANQFSATGEVRLYDTGRRRTQLVEAPVVGGPLHVAARESGATRILFYVGARSAAPLAFPGGGQWWIVRQGAKRYLRATDSAGRADLVLYLGPAAAGADLAIQTVARTPGGARLGTNVVEPVVF